MQANFFFRARFKIFLLLFAGSCSFAVHAQENTPPKDFWGNPVILDWFRSFLSTDEKKSQSRSTTEKSQVSQKVPTSELDRKLLSLTPNLEMSTNTLLQGWAKIQILRAPFLATSRLAKFDSRKETVTYQARLKIEGCRGNRDCIDQQIAELNKVIGEIEEAESNVKSSGERLGNAFHDMESSRVLYQMLIVQYSQILWAHALRAASLELESQGLLQFLAAPHLVALQGNAAFDFTKVSPWVQSCYEYCGKHSVGFELHYQTQKRRQGRLRFLISDAKPNFSAMETKLDSWSQRMGLDSSFISSIDTFKFLLLWLPERLSQARLSRFDLTQDRLLMDFYNIPEVVYNIKTKNHLRLIYAHEPFLMTPEERERPYDGSLRGTGRELIDWSMQKPAPWDLPLRLISADFFSY